MRTDNRPVNDIFHRCNVLCFPDTKSHHDRNFGHLFHLSQIGNDFPMECSCLPGDTHGRYTVHKSSRTLKDFRNPFTGNRGDKLDENGGIGQIQVLIDFILL